MSPHEFRLAKFPASPRCAARADAASDRLQQAVNYFLEEFAGDMAFVRGSEPEQMPHLVAVLNMVVSKAMGRHVQAENTLVSYLREHRFVHGNAQADGRIVLFFYFEDADTGLHADSRNSRRDGGSHFPPQSRSARPAVK